MRLKGEIHQHIRDCIKIEWRRNGDIASAQGTYLHKHVDLALNGLFFDASLPEMYLFVSFLRNELETRGWKTYSY